MRGDILGEDGWIILWGAQEIDWGRRVKNHVWARTIRILFKPVSIIFRWYPNVGWAASSARDLEFIGYDHYKLFIRQNK